MRAEKDVTYEESLGGNRVSRLALKAVDGYFNLLRIRQFQSVQRKAFDFHSLLCWRLAGSLSRLRLGRLLRCWLGGGVPALPLAESRFEGFTEIFVRMQFAGAVDERYFGFDVVGVREAAVHGADRCTGFIVVEAHTFRAEQGVDDLDLLGL